MNNDGRERIWNGHNLKTYFINPFYKVEDFGYFWENEVHHRIKEK